MDLSYFIRGLLIGFSIAAPVGPIGVLCIRRTLAQGRASGLISGLGAATADAIYGSIAGFGLTSVSTFLIGHQVWLRVVGGAFLFYLGLKTILARPAEKSTWADGNRFIGDYFSVFVLTLTNPVTILSFAAIFAGLGLADESGNYASAGALVSGVFIGSSVWWLTLSSVVALFRTSLTPRWLRWTNRLSGIVIMAFGLVAFLSLLG
jgi:threonine/homoserine/homoserine lactone efflux protein